MGKRENADFMRVCGLLGLLRPADYELKYARKVYKRLR